MEQIPSREDDGRLAGQEILSLLRNLNVLYHVHKSPPLVSILSQLNAVPILKPSSLKSILILSFHVRLGLSCDEVKWPKFVRV
jgi:hypothetical protein